MKDRIFNLLACIVLFVPIIFSRFTWEKFETIKLISFVLVVGVILLLSVGHKIRYSAATGKNFAVFIFFAIISSLFAVNKIYSFLGKEYMWIGLYLFSAWSLFVLLLISELTERRLVFLLKIIVVAALINAIISILQTYGIVYNFSWDVYRIGYLIRAVGLMGNPDFTSMFLASSVIINIYLFGSAPDTKIKIYYGVSGFLLIWATILLASRGSILGLFTSFIIAALMLIWSKSNRANYKYIILAAIVGGMLFVNFYPLMRLWDGPGTDIAKINVSTRLNAWTDAWHSILSHPFGVGFGNHEDPHNILLDLLVIGGLPLLISFGLLFAIPIRRLYQKYKRGDDRSQEWLNIVLISAVGSVFVSALFNPVAISVWLLIGVLLAALVFQSQELVELKYKWVGLARLFGAFLVVSAICLFCSQFFLFRGLKQSSQTNYAQATKYYKLARGFDPLNAIIYYNLAESELSQNYSVSEIEKNIQKINSTYPGNAKSYFDSGVLYYKLYQQSKNSQHFDLAMENLRRAITIEPYLSDADFLLASHYYESGDYDSSLEAVQHGLSYSPTYVVGWIILSNIYVQNKNYDAATDALEKAYKMSLDDYMLDPYVFSLKHVLKHIQQGQLPPLLST